MSASRRRMLIKPSPGTIAGSPARCRENLARLVEAGVTSPVFFEVHGFPARQTLDDAHRYLMPHFV